MSVLVYYNNHLFGDRAVLVNSDLTIDCSSEGKKKVYLDPKRRYAVGQVGKLLDSDIWDTVYGFCKWILDNVEDHDKSLSDLKKDWEEMLKRCPVKLDDTHILMVIGPNLIEIVKSTPCILERKRSYAYGTGRNAARVLIHANYEFDLDRWFAILSMSDQNVSRTYDVVDLSLLNTKPKQNRTLVTKRTMTRRKITVTKKKKVIYAK